MTFSRGIAGALFIMAVGVVSNTAYGELGRRRSLFRRPVGDPVASVGPARLAATAVPAATEVAIDILKKGGSAVDAAIAANATLGLMEPVSNGVGGDLFAIVWDPKTVKLYGYNGSGRAAQGRDLAKMIAEVKAVAAKMGKPYKPHIPPMGSLSITVPGAVDAWGRAA